jgi:Tc5 transposase DNA-binding domain
MSPRSSIQNRLNGVCPRNKAQEQSMNRTNIEETELVHWITTLTQRGYAPRYRTVRELVEVIRNRRVIGVNDEDIQLAKYNEFGKAWVTRFMTCHKRLEGARRKCIGAARIKDVSVERLTKWFGDLERIVDEYNMEPKNFYNMDESRFTIGNIKASQRIVNATFCLKFQAKT